MTTDEDWTEIREIRAAMIDEIGTEPLVEVAAVSDVDAGGVPCRVVRPADPVGTILFLHGGGFTFGTRDTHERISRRLADTTRHVVVLADYRLAPEARFPAAVDDVDAVVGWLRDSDLPTPHVVLGDSAGGNLALGAVLAHPGVFSGQVLVYPFLDPAGDSYDASLADAADQLEEYAWYWGLYLDDDRRSDPRADPLRAPSYAGLPPTLVQLAALDVLHTTGRALAERLTGDGVPTRLEVYEGVAHGFWRRSEFPESQQALDAVAAFLRDQAS